MDESESKKENHQKERRLDPELLKKGLRCDLDQYEMLKRCSEKKDMTEWNEWREKNIEEDIWLQGISFREKDKVYLKKVNLRTGGIGKDYEGRVHLEDAIFIEANLESATLEDAYLKGTKFWKTNIKDTNLRGAIIDDETVIWACEVSKKTDCDGVGIDRARIDPCIRQLLEYNTRWRMWEAWYQYKDWYKDCHNRNVKRNNLDRWIRCPVHWFWWISDYGISTGRIMFTFFGLAFIFSLIYYLWGLLTPLGIIDNLFIDRNGVVVSWWVVPFRAFYFSIITMTLGFSDMYANARSICAHVLITFQALLGYVLLGALVTRFAILFTAGGPAGRFADDRGQKTEDR